MKRMFAALLVIALVSPAALAAVENPGEAPPPVVEAVFVLDTTGSMSGLIHAAKEKIWSIGNTLASGDPAPVVRVGLVGFRDRSDGEVTRLVPLSTDMDDLYTRLMEFQASGGGDGPESVNQALHEAVTRVEWTGGPTAYKVIFLLGDAPPHMDYPDDVKYPATAKIAREMGIVVNTVQLGSSDDTRKIFQEIASLCGGVYTRLGQNAGALVKATPYDGEIAKLSRSLDETRLYYGSDKEQKAAEVRKEKASRIYGAASVSAVAQRSLFNTGKAGKKNFLGKNELVDAVAEGEVDVNTLSKDELPEPLREMNDKEREEHVKGLAQKREGLQEQIQALAAKRQDFLKKEMAKKDKTLESELYQAVQAQAAAKGIEYDGGPSL